MSNATRKKKIDSQLDVVIESQESQVNVEATETEVVVNEVTTDEIVVSEPEINTTVEAVPDVEVVNTVSKTPGRPVLADSKRQQRLLELEVKRLNGELKKGRPVSDDSKRQQRQKDLEEKRAAGLLKPGRPKYTAEQKLEAERVKAERKVAEEARIKELAKQMLAENKSPEEILAAIEG